VVSQKDPIAEEPGGSNSVDDLLVKITRNQHGRRRRLSQPCRTIGSYSRGLRFNERGMLIALFSQSHQPPSTGKTWVMGRRRGGRWKRFPSDWRCGCVLCSRRVKCRAGVNVYLRGFAGFESRYGVNSRRRGAK